MSIFSNSFLSISRILPNIEFLSSSVVSEFPQGFQINASVKSEFNIKSIALGFLEKNPKGALNFWWPKTDKQIRIEGVCKKTSTKESEEYFFSRPRSSQISASISRQSKTILSYESLLDSAKTLEMKTLGKALERPERWGGYSLSPKKIEFWINKKSRLHKRELFTLKSDEWHKTLLSP